MTALLARQVARSLSPASSSLKRNAASAAAGLSNLKNPSLLPQIDSSQPTFDVYNPAKPDTVVGHVNVMGLEHTQEAIQKSHQVLPSWRDGTTASERARLLREWSRLIDENADDIAVIMTQESGKPLKESKGEIVYGRSFIDYFAAEAIRPTSAGGGFLAPTPFANAEGAPRGQVMVMYQAVGVTAMITPWNFPIAMITRKVGPALAAGCTAIVKPAQATPLTALALRQLAIEAGIPADVFQVITATSTAEVGKELCSNPLVRKLSCTGSTKVGKLLMKQSSETLQRLSLELGGNAPFVVFDDYHDRLDEAVDAAIASKFRYAGQTCVCSDRFLIHESIIDDFTHKLVEKVKTLKMGDSMDSETQIGPLINTDAVEGVAAKVDEAIKEGAKCLIGGKRREDLGKNFYEPTVLVNVSTDSKIWNTETFGPVVAICSFSTEEEALEMANAGEVGLACYFCTRDLSRAFRIAKAIEAGIVGVNEGIISTAVAPFGGLKESGFGREGSPMGISEYLETKYVFMNF